MTAGVKVAYPFGHGLSYTTFEYSGLNVSDGGVSFIIKNTGGVDGAEIAQLYLGKDNAKVFRPAKELKGFKKVFIKAGESVTVNIPFDDKTFRYFNVLTDKWETEGGEYKIYIGASSADVRLEGEITRGGTTEQYPYSPEKLPSYYSGKVSAVKDEEFSGRAFSGIIRFAIAFCYKTGHKVNANTMVMGVLHQPVRGLAKYGRMSRRKMEGLLLMFNGHFFKGLHYYCSKEKVKKAK